MAICTPTGYGTWLLMDPQYPMPGKASDMLRECYRVYAQVAAAMSKIDPTIRLRKPPTETRE